VLRTEVHYCPAAFAPQTYLNFIVFIAMMFVVILFEMIKFIPSTEKRKEKTRK
jgi:hypothetical protein